MSQIALQHEYSNQDGEHAVMQCEYQGDSCLQVCRVQPNDAVNTVLAPLQPAI